MNKPSLWADRRIGGLRRFAIAISILNIVGHGLLGFEQSLLQVFVALSTAYCCELALETVDAHLRGRRPRYTGSRSALVDFLLSAHITGLAVSMLLYASDRTGVVAFAAATAIGSKALVRLPSRLGGRHILNPSNFGISAVLVLFPWVAIAPPYQFTENVSGAVDWILPGIIVVTGSFLNTKFTGRVPLLLAWLVGFVVQATLRSWVYDSSLVAGLTPMTGLAFVLFTFYMVTDPATTPSSRRGQLVFGFGVAMVYGILMVSHVVFGLFFSLTTVCILRGMYLWVKRDLPTGHRAATAPGS